jgi:hypothetical protein
VRVSSRGGRFAALAHDDARRPATLSDRGQAVYLADHVLRQTKRPTRVADIVDAAAARPRNDAILSDPGLIATKARILAISQPCLRGWSEMAEIDVRSHQALVDVFQKEGVLKERVDVRTLLLKPADLA